jgi:hypothetical protein
MEELLDMIASDESPSQISDRIKDILYVKSADKIDQLKPQVAASLFSGDE